MIARSLAIVCAAIIGMAWTSSVHSADGGGASRGKVLYQDCAGCHGNAGQGSDIAPDLRGIVGRKVADDGFYTYSGAMRKYGGTWSEARLVAFLRSPQTTVSGNRMPYDGVATNAQAHDLVSYLKTLK